MIVWLVMVAEYRWDIHDVIAVYSTQEAAEEAREELNKTLLEGGRPENRISSYVEGFEVL